MRDIAGAIVSHRVVEIPGRICGWSNIVGISGKGRKTKPGGGFYANLWDTIDSKIGFGIS